MCVLYFLFRVGIEVDLVSRISLETSDRNQAIGKLSFEKKRKFSH